MAYCICLRKLSRLRKKKIPRSFEYEKSLREIRSFQAITFYRLWEK
ncbi:hypothetical protein HMPREF1981_00350 [Bacteroides pyogenes F0041]|uniref:Uncharacterized protein n=1 Tax=Bacteroides pyogenes F0041 TaxID=1321819 RepID=U2CVY9_9BACE|nr:hypothetical protein HMPREF1981_00350 [Bacteroides pyogenes F0041]